MNRITKRIQIPILKMFNHHIYKNGIVEIWFLVLIVCGYTLFSSFAVPLGIENSRIFSVPYRVLIFVLSILIIVKNFSFKKFKNIAVLSVLFFWLFYLFRSYFSFSNDNYDELFRPQFSEIYVRIIVIAMVPAIALLFINYKNLNYRKVVDIFFVILFTMLSLNLIFALINFNGSSLGFMFSMYYISYGHLGASLSLLSLFLILYQPRNFNIVFPYAAFLLGLFTIVIATARSPFLAVIVVIPYLILVTKNYKVFGVFCLLLLISVTGIYIIGKSGSSSFIFANRTYNWLFEGDNSLRTPLFENGLRIFKDNPIFGGRTHFKNGFYPHNLIIELLMGTGIFGLVLYVLKFIPVIKKFKIFTFQNKKSYHLLFFALFLQYFVLVITSFTLYSVPEFLYFSSIIIGISLSNANEENESDDGSRNSSRNN